MIYFIKSVFIIRQESLPCPLCVKNTLKKNPSSFYDFLKTILIFVFLKKFQIIETGLFS